ncbi:MAG: M67 family metallopeptidase, partial [Thermofilaceae archaeon]
MELSVSVQPIEKMYRILLPKSVASSIIEHIKGEYPIEACGALLGHVTSNFCFIDETVPLRNILASTTSFWFDVSEWMQVIINARKVGLEYIGLYHSHARDEPLPSLSDRHRMMECPGECWLIVAYKPGYPVRFAAYRIDDYGSSISSIPL